MSPRRLHRRAFVLLAVVLAVACTVPDSREEAEAAGWHELRKYCAGEGLDPDGFILLEVTKDDPGWAVEFEEKKTTPPKLYVRFLFQQNGFVNTSLLRE